MDPQDIQRELDRLWERVSSSPGGSRELEPALPSSLFTSPLEDTSSVAREATREVVALIKRRHEEQLSRLRGYVDLKERSVQGLLERLRASEAEAGGLRKQALEAEERIRLAVTEVAAQLEAAQNRLQAEEDRFRQEEAVLRRIADETRRQLAAETSQRRELEARWSEREQEYLLEIRDLQARAEQAFKAQEKGQGLARQSRAELQEAKSAIEKTLAELLRERHERGAADKERDQALKRVSELEGHIRELQNLWEEERKSWQELWDRERSTWETQRQEFSSWEQKLRQEREAWHAQLRQLEGQESRYREQMSEILRRSTDAGEKVAQLLRRAAEGAKEQVRAAAGPRRRRLAWAAAAFLLAAGAYPAWRALSRLELRLAEAHEVPADNPSGMAFGGSALWLSDWDGGLLSLDPSEPSRALSEARVAGSGPYRPTALALWGDALYSLDSAQGRILKHDVSSPGRPVLSWRSPGPAPTALAHDGRNLWSYDAATRAVYRHLGEGSEAQTEAHRLELDVLPRAMAWHEGRLWAYDAKGRQVVVLALKGGVLRLVESVPLKEPLKGLSLVYRSGKGGAQRLEMWALSAPFEGAAPSLRKYRVSRGLFKK